MLDVKRSITLTGSSKIDGKTAMYMSANIAKDSKTSSNSAVMDQALYDANKKECRKDLADFQDTIYDVEDSLETEEPENAGDEEPTNEE